MSTPAHHPARWNTRAGHDQIREILKGCVPTIEPHDYQTHGIAISLDGDDLVATMATGSGKTGYFCFLMCVIIAISINPVLAIPGSHGFPKNPAMLVVLPTKALQEDMRKSMTRWGLQTAVINGDTTQAASEGGQNLWMECRNKYSVILISPEELLNPQFRMLLHDQSFKARICRFGVDEVHLVHVWGKTFRESFLQLGHIRSRLPSINGGNIPGNRACRDRRVLPDFAEYLSLLELVWKVNSFEL